MNPFIEADKNPFLEADRNPFMDAEAVESANPFMQAEAPGGLISPAGEASISSMVGSAAKKTGASILHTLGYLNRPNLALWEGVRQGLSDTPGETFLGGAWKGLTGKSETELADVLGLPTTSPTDTWPGYLAKGGARFLVNMAGDPLTYAGPGLIKAGGKGISALAKGAGYGEELAKIGKARQAASEWIAGTTIGKHLWHYAPTGNEAFDLQKQAEASLANKALRELGEKIQVARDAIQRAEKEGFALHLNDPLTDKIIFNQLERGPHNPWRNLIPDYVTEAFEDVRKVSFDKFQEENTARAALKVALRKEFPEDQFYKFMPHSDTELAKYREASMLPEFGGGKPTPGQSRTLQRWVLEKESDPFFTDRPKLVDPQGAPGPILTEGGSSKKYFRSLKKAGIKVEEDGTYTYKGQRVVPQAASMHDIIQAADIHGSDLAKRFLTSPELAVAADVYQKQARITFFRFLHWVGENADNAVDDLGKPLYNWAKDASEQAIAEGYRPLKIALPGMGKKVFKPWTANHLENMYQMMVDPESATSVMTKGFQALMNTKFGKILGAYNQTWKRNQLALFPGFHVANLASNQVLIFLSGARNPVRGVEAFNLLWGGKGESNLLKMSWEQAQRKLSDTGLFNTGMTEAGLEGVRGLGGELRKATKLRFTEMMGGNLKRMGVPEKIANVPSTVAKTLEEANDFGFRIGATIENHGKATIALDYIAKALKKGRILDDRLWNESALHAKKFMFDYALLTPFETQLKNVFPFLSWYRNLIGLSLKQLGTIEGIANIEKIRRITDFVLTPMDPSDRRIVPPYVSGPAKGIMPLDMLRAYMGYPNRGNEMFDVSRFHALGSLQQFVDRPADAILSNLGPIPKFLIEAPSGKSYFTGREIDKLAGGMGMGLVNPTINTLTGANLPYETNYRKFMGMSMPASLDYILSSYTPISRYAGTTSTLLSNMENMPLGYNEPARKPMTTGEKAIWLATGGKAEVFDRGKWQRRMAGTYEEELNYIKRQIRDAASRGDNRRLKFYQEQLIEKSRANPFMQ